MARHPALFRKHHQHDPDREFSPPPCLDEAIRVAICTSGSAEDLAGRVQRAIGEYSGTRDELHVSHAIAPGPHPGQMLYSALIVLRPATAEPIDGP